MARLISERVSISDCLPEGVHDAPRVDFMLCRFVHSHLTRTTRAEMKGNGQTPHDQPAGSEGPTRPEAKFESGNLYFHLWTLGHLTRRNNHAKRF
jgi:hypothetical protein